MTLVHPEDSVICAQEKGHAKLKFFKFFKFLPILSIPVRYGASEYLPFASGFASAGQPSRYIDCIDYRLQVAIGWVWFSRMLFRDSNGSWQDLPCCFTRKTAMAVSSLAKSLRPIAFRSFWVPIECCGTVVELPLSKPQVLRERIMAALSHVECSETGDKVGR